MSYYKDQFGLLKTMPGIAEKTAKYLIAYLEYHMALSRQETEMKFYSKLLEETLKKPEDLKIGFISGNLDAETLKAEIRDSKKDIHLVADPNNPRLVYYNSKDSEALLNLISQMQIQAKLDYENNRYIEEDYGFYNEKTGDFIPFRDEEGNYLDREGALHFGQFATEEQRANPEALTDSLIFQGHQPGKVWYKDTNGNLHDDNGLLYEVMISDGHFYSDAINSALPDEALPVISQTEASIQAELRQVYAEINPDDEYIRTANGNMCNVRTGQIVEIRNEYGDKISESGQVTLNTRYAENYTSRVSQLHRGTVDTVSVYHFDPATGSFATEDRAQVVPLRSEAGFEYTKGYVDRAAGQAMYQAYHTTAKGHLVNGHGNDLILHNAYGDYYDKSGVFITSNQPGPALAERKRQLDLVCGQITEGNYRMTPKGLVKENGRDDNSPVRVYNQYGSYINEKTGLRVTSPAELDNGIALERVPGGFRDPESGNFIPNCSPYGDYYDADLDRVVFNTNIIGHEDYRKALVEGHEKNPADAGSLYLQDENGFIVKPETGVVITIFDDNGRKIGAENFVTIDELHQVFDEGLLFEEDKELNGFDERTKDEEEQEEQEAETGEEQPGETESEDQEEILIAEEEEKGSKRKTHKAEEQQHESDEYSEEYNAAADAYSNTEEIYATGDAEDTIITAGEYPSQTDNTASPEAVQTMASASEPVKAVSAEINEETEIPKADQTVNQVTAAEMKMPAEPVYENLSAADAAPTESISSTAAETAAKADRPAPETPYEQIVTETASSTSPERAAQEVQPKPQLQTEGEAIHAAPSEAKQGGSTTSTPQDIPYANVQTTETFSNNAAVSSEKTHVESAQKPADGAAVPKQPLVNDETYYDDFVSFNEKLDAYEKSVDGFKAAQKNLTNAEAAKNTAEETVQNAQQAQYKAAEIKTAAETDYIEATSAFVKREAEYKTARQKYESAGTKADATTVSRYEEAKKSFESASAARTEAGTRLQEAQLSFTSATKTLNSAKFEYDQRAASFSEAQSAFNRAAETHSEARKIYEQAIKTESVSFGRLATDVVSVESTYRAVPRTGEFDVHSSARIMRPVSPDTPTYIVNGLLEKEGFRRLKNHEGLPFHKVAPATGTALYPAGSHGTTAVRGSQHLTRAGGSRVLTEKAFGFNEMTLGKRLASPSSYGISSAISRAMTTMVRNAAEEEGTTYKGFSKVYPAMFHAFSGAGGSAMLQTARQNTFNAFNGTSVGGNVGMLSKDNRNMILNFANMDPDKVDFTTISGIDKLHSNIVSVAAKKGLVEQRGGMWILTKNAKNMTPAMLAELNLTEAQWKILKTHIEIAAKAQSGAALVSGAWSLVRQRIRMAVTEADDTFRSAAQVTNTFSMGMNTAEMITKHLPSLPAWQRSRLEGIKRGLEIQDDTSIKAFRKQMKKERKNAVNKADKKQINKKMQEKMANLRQRDKAQRWQRLHRNALKKNPDKLQKSIDKLSNVSNKTGAFSNKLERVFHPLRHYIQKTTVYKVVSQKIAESAIGKLFSSAMTAVSSFISTILSALAPYLIVAAISFLLTGIVFGLLAMMTVNLPMSAEVVESNTDLSRTIENMYDKSNSITGILYNELRYQELDWAYESTKYGTKEKEILLKNMTFTEKNVDAKTYANSVTGERDLLGVWAINTSQTEETQEDAVMGTYDEVRVAEGILGDEPFIGALDHDRKLLQSIDMGNQFELRGNPQGGKTSNAKQITSMAQIFYDQQVDTMKENMHSVDGLKKLGAGMKYLWKSAWTKATTEHIPILEQIADKFGWSWTALVRDYAFPLAQASHQENFFLSQYIMPTLYTKPNSDSFEGVNPESHFDGANSIAEGDSEISQTRDGNQSVKVSQTTGQKALHGEVGIGIEGGTGKITSQFLQEGDEGYLEYEYCPEDMYNGYGCQKRYEFVYQLPEGFFATDRDGNVLSQEALKTLYYRGDPENPYDILFDVSADVSPWCEDGDTVHMGDGIYEQNACIVHARQLTDDGFRCWEKITDDENSGIDWRNGRGIMEKLNDDSFKSSNLVKTIRKYGYKTYIQHISLDGDVINIIVSNDDHPKHYDAEYGTRYNYDPVTGDIIGSEQYTIREAYDDIAGWEYTTIQFKHACTGKHVGYYCGGHLQLRTRGVVYGFSETQENVGAQVMPGHISAYAPKFLDPDNIEAEAAEFGNRTIYVIEDHLSNQDQAYIENIQEKMPRYKDLFEIDADMLRPADSFPGMLQNDLQVTETETGTITKWKSWTLQNMGQAVDMATVDWTSAYNLADTETMTGGLYKNSDGGYGSINAVNDDVKTKILELLGADNLNMNADLDDSEPPKNKDGSVMTEEDKQMVDRIRHIKYALNTLGKVGYAQSQHGYVYEDVKGKLTDCSGYVCNIWLDHLYNANEPGIPVHTYGTSSLASLANENNCLHNYTGPDCGIKPGDIILKNPDGEDAHALLYIGCFSTDELYSYVSTESSLKDIDSNSKLVFTIDCSTMKLKTSQLPVRNNGDKVTNWARGFEILNTFLNWIGSEDKETIAGIVRFQARDYLNNNTSGYTLQYIDMESMPLTINGIRLTGEDYTETGLVTDRNRPDEYWTQDAQNSDLSASRSTKEIEYPRYVMFKQSYPIEENANGYDTSYEEVDDPDRLAGFKRSGEVVLPMKEYINQGSYGHAYRGGNTTIQGQACCDCSYAMCAAYYTGKSYNMNTICRDYVNGNGWFMNGSFLPHEGCSEINIRSRGIQGIYDALDAGHPVIFQINGTSFSFHPRPSSHFMVIMGYKDDRFYLYDPGNRANTYGQTTGMQPSIAADELRSKWSGVKQVQEIVSSTYSNPFENVSSWSGVKLTKRLGTVQGPSGRETYYNPSAASLGNAGMTPAKAIAYSVELAKNTAEQKYQKNLDGNIWVNDQGLVMLGNYIIVASPDTGNYSNPPLSRFKFPRGSLIETSLGTAVVVDLNAGGNAIDLCVNW